MAGELGRQATIVEILSHPPPPLRLATVPQPDNRWISLFSYPMICPYDQEPSRILCLVIGVDQVSRNLFLYFSPLTVRPMFRPFFAAAGFLPPSLWLDQAPPWLYLKPWLASHVSKFICYQGNLGLEGL